MWVFNILFRLSLVSLNGILRGAEVFVILSYKRPLIALYLMSHLEVSREGVLGGVAQVADCRNSVEVWQ